MRKFCSKQKMTSNWLVLACCFALLTGCYEGWDETSSSANKDEPKAENESKLIGYALLETFRLSDAAIDDPTCFSPGNEEFRKAEWASRISSLKTALQKISDKVVSNHHEIGTSDCSTLATIEQASLDAKPWGDNAPGQISKPMVHVKAVFWDSDVGGSPSSLVKEREWNAWSNLQKTGSDARSVHHFNLENENNGYLASWRNAKKSSSKNATAIDNVDATPAGITARAKTIADDTSAFIAWLKDEVVKPLATGLSPMAPGVTP